MRSNNMSAFFSRTREFFRLSERITIDIWMIGKKIQSLYIANNVGEENLCLGRQKHYLFEKNTQEKKKYRLSIFQTIFQSLCLSP